MVEVTPGLPSPSSSVTRGSFGSVGSGSFAGSARVTPIPVGVSGREMRARPPSTVRVTGVGTGSMAWVAVSESVTWMGWSLRCSELQNDSLATSVPSSTVRSVNP